MVTLHGEPIKVGDKVFSLTNGWDIITGISDFASYPIETNETVYTIEGKRYKDDLTPTIFWDEITVEIPKRPLPQLEVDTKVLVWNDNPNRKFNSYFSHFDENGSIYAFSGGRTSWSAKGVTSDWNHWELADD